jgi:PAS domain S-box-containing protein
MTPDGADPPGGLGWQAVAVDAVDVGIVVSGPDGVRYANPAGAAILEVEGAGLLGPPSLPHVAVFDEAGEAAPDDWIGAGRALVEGVVVDTRSRLVFSDGHQRWVASRSAPIVLDGQAAVVSTLTDVTGQMAAEAKVAAGRSRLQQVLDVIDASVFVKKLDGTYSFVNSTFEREVGLPSAEILGRHPTDLAADPAAAAEAEAQDARVISSGEAVTEVLSLGERTYLTSKTPLRDAAGQIEAVVGISTNISDQVRAAEAEAIAVAVVQSSPEGIVTFDRHQAITSVNPMAQAMAGRPESELVGLPIHAVALTVDPGEAAELAARVLAGESMEYERAWSDGSVRGLTVVVRVDPVRDATGEVVGGAVSVRDVTRLRHVEAERLRMQHELEHVERLDSLGQLAGGVAHDFNNLLAAIKLTSEMLVGSLPAGSEDQQQAQRIVAVTERAADLTNQLLVFARRETPSTERVEVNDLVRQADALLARTLGEHIERRLELVSRACVVEVDPARLEQVIVNLAVNARDAMPDGGALLVRTEVTVLDEHDQEIFRTRAPGPHVVVSVTDEGDGMDDETRRQAFEPFFTTKPRGQGTGLGLATVYAVSIQAGGGTWIYSEPGRGTVVKVALPLVGGPWGSLSEDAGPTTLAVTGRGRRVVVVEDEAALRDVAERLLVRAGYAVEAFPDGAALLDALPALAEPDVLLTDVVMPGISGPEAAELLRERFPATRVVFMSGYTAGLMGGRRAEGEVLSKPFSSATLVAAIERALAPGGDGG